MKGKIVNFKSKLTFGKYRGKTIKYVYQKDAQYLAWLLNNTKKLLLSAADQIKIYKRSEYRKVTEFNWDFREGK